VQEFTSCACLGFTGVIRLEAVESSYFADASLFPRGSATFDCALIMRNIAHEWHSAANMYV